MTRKEFQEYQKKSRTGEIEDELNPVFILTLTTSSLLCKVVNGELDLNELAKRELENRGLDMNGNWIGIK